MHWMPIALIIAGIVLVAALWRRAWEVVHQVRQRTRRQPPPKP